jgi:hypothetical protein
MSRSLEGIFFLWMLAQRHVVNSFVPQQPWQRGSSGTLVHHPSCLGIQQPGQQRVLDFETSTLLPNTFSQIKWLSTGESVSPHSYRLGLDPELTKVLLEYCHETGITETFASLLVHGNPLSPGTGKVVPLLDCSWYIQRPGLKWTSNAHWISPFDERTHDEYLKVLSRGGFDQVLDSIGKQFGFDGLVAYHLTFIGVSHCTKGFMHHDFEDIQGKGFNLIIPLILAKDAEPELDLEQRGNEDLVGRYKYELNEANMVGDRVGHATSACDYLSQGEMRMAATIYIADVNADNIRGIVDDFTQAHPPRGNYQYLLDRAGSHWKSDDATRHLPTMEQDPKSAPLLF